MEHRVGRLRFCCMCWREPQTRAERRWAESMYECLEQANNHTYPWIYAAVHGIDTLLRNWLLLSRWRHFPLLRKPKVYYRVPATRSYTELNEYSSHSHTRSSLMLSYHMCLSFPKNLFPSCFPTRTVYEISIYTTRINFHVFLSFFLFFFFELLALIMPMPVAARSIRCRIHDLLKRAVKLMAVLLTSYSRGFNCVNRAVYYLFTTVMTSHS
jgi:hypothetical protein